MYTYRNTHHTNPHTHTQTHTHTYIHLYQLGWLYLNYITIVLLISSIYKYSDTGRVFGI